MVVFHFLKKLRRTPKDCKRVCSVRKHVIGKSSHGRTPDLRLSCPNACMQDLIENSLLGLLRYFLRGGGVKFLSNFHHHTSLEGPPSANKQKSVYCPASCSQHETKCVIFTPLKEYDFKNSTYVHIFEGYPFFALLYHHDLCCSSLRGNKRAFA